jgi:hypothetical protein
MPSGHNGIGMSKVCFLGSENMKTTRFLSCDKKYESNNVQITASKLRHILN